MKKQIFYKHFFVIFFLISVFFVNQNCLRNIFQLQIKDFAVLFI